MADTKTLGIALGMGVVSGMRSLSALAILSHGLSDKSFGKPVGRAASLLRSAHVSRLLTALAASEMAADKLPFLPDRTDVAPLLGRATLGAVAGITVADITGSPRWPAAVLASLGAIASTIAFHRIRKVAGERTAIPDGVLAVVEDGLVLLLGSRLSKMLVE